MEFISNIRVTKYTLTVDGLMISYSKSNGMTVLQCDKSTACAMLVRIGVIEDFISNGQEPVILTLDVRPEKYRLELWSVFVLEFIFTIEMAQSIVQEYCRHKSRQNLRNHPDIEDVDL